MDKNSLKQKIEEHRKILEQSQQFLQRVKRRRVEIEEEARKRRQARS